MTISVHPEPGTRVIPRRHLRHDVATRACHFDPSPAIGHGAELEDGTCAGDFNPCIISDTLYRMPAEVENGRGLKG